MSTERLEFSLEKLARALDRLDEVLALPGEGPMIDATIQRFEFSVELLWKTLKRALEDSGRTAPATPREVFGAAWQTGWLEDDEPLWRRMVADRNRTTHVYDDATAREIYLRIRDYAPAMRRAFDALCLRFGPPRSPGPSEARETTAAYRKSTRPTATRPRPPTTKPRENRPVGEPRRAERPRRGRHGPSAPARQRRTTKSQQR
ncbi:MAG: nucleotidyltransferase substrate binding protein [Deltaproteobacteria bacterium]|nr:nucleotidyltransferase substrate binding protein [Deltaproteobacteria bacterium]